MYVCSGHCVCGDTLKMSQKKYQQILDTEELLPSDLQVPNQEQEASITIQNSKPLNKANYLLAEIRRSQTIPSGTTGF
jgi:hypothetical protein